MTTAVMAATDTAVPHPGATGRAPAPTVGPQPAAIEDVPAPTADPLHAATGRTPAPTHGLPQQTDITAIAGATGPGPAPGLRPAGADTGGP